MATTLTCQHCGGELASGDRFCPLCGAESLACGSCGRPLLANDQSCPHCGTRAEHAIPQDAGTQGAQPSPWADLVERLRRATLGEFEIGGELGRGGMAAVFLAHDIALDRKVAIKVMSPALMMGDGMIDRFRHEAITVANLHHPNIVPVYSVRQAEGLHFFIMRHVEGRSLEQVIAAAGRLPLPIVRSILHQVGTALAYAHRAQVVHRDIKPANILVDCDGNAVVTDFGIAKAAERPSRTLTGGLVGTPAYMSPEQCNGEEVTAAADQYALGAVAYEMLTGSPPFSGSTLTVMQAHVEQSPAPLVGRCHGCPDEVEAAILRMLAKSPSSRWPRLLDAIAALGAAPLADDDPARAELSRLAMGGGSPPAEVPVPTSPIPRTRPSPAGGAARAVGGISIVPAPAGFEVGDSFLLAAVLRGPHGTRLPPQALSWSTDAPGVLRLDPSGGTATGVAVGSALLTATCKGVQAVLRVEVAEPQTDEIVIGPVVEPLHVGDSIRLDATPRDKRGWPISRPVAWESAQPEVAAATADGGIAGLATGTVRITAVLDDARASIVIPVLPARVAVLELAGAPSTMAAGDTFLLGATPLDRSNRPLAERTVVWSSSDVDVAVVTAEGWVAALRPGPVVLTAACEGVSASVRLTVLARSAAPETRGAGRRRSRRAGSLRAAALGLGVLLASAGLWLRYRPLDRREPETAASLPAAAAVAAVDLPIVDSSAPAMLAITRRPTRALRPGAAFRLAAEVRDLAGRPVENDSLVWSSSDSTIVRADPPTGRIRGVRPGRAWITAADGDRRDSTLVAVRPPEAATPEAASLAIAPAGPLQVGDSVLLNADVLDAAGDTLAGSEIVWSSTNAAVATVDPRAGMVRARAPGKALILARSGEESTLSELTVVPVPVASVRVLGARPLAVGDVLELDAVALDGGGGELRGRQMAWSSNNPSILGVDPSTGAVEARAPGTAEITAATGGKSGVAVLRVAPRPEPAAPARGWAEERLLAEARLRAGVEACYGALQARDAARLAALYRPVSRSDEEKLKRLSRILSTREWDAKVSERVDGTRRLGLDIAAAEFSVTLTWKDAFGGRLTSRPVFRAEFARTPSGWEMSSCRIIGSPTL
jgi:uncharacterized protein YjdB